MRQSRWGKGSIGPRGPYKNAPWDNNDPPLVKARKILGLTQHQAAAELGVPRSMLAKWESGHAQQPKWGDTAAAIKAFIARAAKVKETK